MSNIKEMIYKTEDKLLEIGIDPSLSGFRYIVDCVVYCLLHCVNVGNISVTNELYPTVAQQNKTSALRVERCIRVAIEKAFSNTTNFPKALISVASGKVTNGTFIAYVVLMMQREI